METLEQERKEAERLHSESKTLLANPIFKETILKIERELFEEFTAANKDSIADIHNQYHSLQRFVDTVNSNIIAYEMQYNIN